MTLESSTDSRLFWGDEMQYLIDALKWYEKFRVMQIKDIEKRGRTSLFTVNYIGCMTNQLKDKVKSLTRDSE